MEYKGTLLAVKDMKTSVAFYNEVLGLKIEADFGTNVMLESGIYLQTLESWKGFIKREATLGGGDAELYFEEEDIEGFMSRLKGMQQLSYVHSLVEHSWGQRAVRFYDPDEHIIEVGERLSAVCRRFKAEGMSVDQIAQRMDVSKEFVLQLLQTAYKSSGD